MNLFVILPLFALITVLIIYHNSWYFQRTSNSKSSITNIDDTDANAVATRETKKGEHQEYHLYTFINYADSPRWYDVQMRSTKWAQAWGVSYVINYKRSDLDADFVEKASSVIHCPRGGGYWCWKPQIIWQTMNKVGMGSYVVYCDSGSQILEPLDSLISRTSYISAFRLLQPLAQWTKQYAIQTILGTDYVEDTQHAAGLLCFRVCTETKDFVQEWCNYACDIDIIGDDIVVGYEERADFIENRHDQTIFSLLCYKYPHLISSLPFDEYAKQHAFGSA